MNEIDSTQNFNLNSYYSSDTKIKHPTKNIAQAPIILPKAYSFSDKDADRKMQFINADIYTKTKQENAEHKFNKKTFFKIFSCVTLAILGFLGFRKFFRKS